MASGENKVFIITESGSGLGLSFNETPAKFEWDAKTQSSPRQAWEWVLRMRTVRTEYPGTERPTEQILGPHYEPFDLSGVWDDRYAGSGFAKETLDAFEAMVKRGRLVTVQFEDISFEGIITNFKPSYHRKYQIGYSFTLSPHAKNGDGPVTNEPNKSWVESADVNPDTMSDRIKNIIIAASLIHLDAPKIFINGSLHATVSTALGVWVSHANTINSILANQVISTADEVNSFARLTQSFVALKQSAIDMLPELRSQSTTTALAFEGPVPVLDFESWARGLSRAARELVVAAHESARNLARFTASRPLALYRPRAGESLYNVSIRFFGTPHRWKDIYDRNGLFEFTLDGSEILVIPQAG